MKKSYFTPVFLTTVSGDPGIIDATKSQEGTVGTGVTSKDFASLADSLGLATTELESYMTQYADYLEGFNVNDPDTYYILQEYLLDYVL